MRKLLTTLFVAMLMAGFGPAISAEEPVRTWTDLKGRKMEASFVQFADDKVIIRRDDGVSFSVSPAIFSEEDRKYLAELSQKPNQTKEVEPDAPVIFKDAKLEAAVRKELNKSDDSALTQKDLAMLESLKAGQGGITSLAGLEHATNLSKLMLWNNQITDAAPLANLINLTLLDISSNKINDVMPLAKLTKLDTLDLGFNPIADVTPLTNLSNLTLLLLGNSSITDAQKAIFKKALPKCKILF